MRPARKGPENRGKCRSERPQPLDASMRPARKGPENLEAAMRREKEAEALQ